MKNKITQTAKNLLLAGALAMSPLAKEVVAAPISGNVVRTIPVPVENNSAIEAAWYNMTFQNLYTTKEGKQFNQGAVINTDLGVTVKGISGDVYMNHVLQNNGRVNDLEFTLSANPINNNYFSVRTNVGHWIFPNVGFSNSQNVKVTITPKRMPLGADVSLSAQKLWSEESNGSSYVLGIGKSMPVGKATVTAGVDFVYNNGFYSSQHNYSATNPRLGVKFPVRKGLDLVASYTSQNPTTDFRNVGADSRNIFKVSMNFDLKKLMEK